MDFSAYVALGDSVSIDLYPALDAGEIDVAVALERVPSAGRVAPLGAASLLYRNSEEIWPEEIGNDLTSRYPGITLVNLAADGATIGDVFGEQLPLLATSDEPTLITLTIGGNDLLSALGHRLRAPLLEGIAQDVVQAYELLVESIRAARPTSVVILSTVYDPSDRTGRVPGLFDESGKLSLRGLDLFNEHVRKFALGTPWALLADVYAHFLGHGVTVPESDRWYWRRSLIEPNAAGANEIRRVWLDALLASERPASQSGHGPERGETR
jgi:lysophospholipase L1-like esterase